MSRKILYIINPIAGTGAQKDLKEFISKKTQRKGFPFIIFPSVSSGDYSFLHPIIKEEKVTDVVIAGGDGTISQAVGNLMDLDVNFGVLPCGSGNGLAYTLRISRSINKALDTVFNGTPYPIDGFYLNEHFSLMLAGLGFDAQVAKDFAQKKRRGLATYIQLALKNFISMKPYPFEISFNNENFNIDAYFISFANSNQFGNNFRIAPQASLSDGLLDVVIVTGRSKLSFVFQTLKQFAGLNRLQTASKVKINKGLIYFQTDRINIKNIGLAPLHIDGEPAEPAENIEVVINKKCFNIIHPAS